MKKLMSMMTGVAMVGLMGTAAYMMMDKKKQAKVDKILANAADEANKMMKNMENK